MKRLQAGDTVIVITGTDKGKKGKVLSVMGDKVIVEGINMKKKYVKKNVMGQNQAGTMVEIERPFNSSNVLHIDPKTGKGTRISYKEVEGKKVRVSVSSGEVIVPVAEETKKAAKKTSKKTTTKKTAVKKKTTTKKVAKSKTKKNEAA